MKGHTDTVLGVAFQPGGGSSSALLATGAMDHTVILWDVQTLSAPILATRLTDLEGEILWLFWHSSGQFLLAGCSDGRAAMWSATTKSLVQYFVCGDSVTVGIWSHNEKKLILGSNDGMVRVFSPKSGEVVACPTGSVSPTALCIVPIHPDAVVVGMEDGRLVIASLEKHKVVHELKDVHDQAIESISCHGSLGLMGCVSCDCVVSMWNCDTYTVRYLVRHDDGITRALWLGNMFLAGTLNGALLKWDGRQEYSEETAVVFRGHQAAILDLRALTDKSVITTSDDATLRVFSME